MGLFDGIADVVNDAVKQVKDVNNVITPTINVSDLIKPVNNLANTTDLLSGFSVHINDPNHSLTDPLRPIPR